MRPERYDYLPSANDSYYILDTITKQIVARNLSLIGAARRAAQLNGRCPDCNLELFEEGGCPACA